MASGKEIRTKIASVRSTQKITKAMEMIAASKLRRTQQRMAASRPYAEKIRTVIGHLSEANPDYRHPYLDVRDVKRVGYIVITTDRGLAGPMLPSPDDGVAVRGIEFDEPCDASQLLGGDEGGPRAAEGIGHDVTFDAGIEKNVADQGQGLYSRMHGERISFLGGAREAGRGRIGPDVGA